LGNKKLDVYNWLSHQGGSVRFLANVLLTSPDHSGRAALRLRRVAKLVKAGKDGRFAQFNIHQLQVDGKDWTWEELDS